MSNVFVSFERKTLWVVALTLAMMLLEIFYGLATHSMALLADGIHMGSHVLAIGLSWMAYRWIRHLQKRNPHRFNASKILSLAGYTSGLVLLIFALGILFQAMQRFYSPLAIQFSEALVVAVAGLVVNLVSAYLLHHDEAHSDHNIRAAYLHVVADAFTSIMAIAGLVANWWWQITWLDTLGALLSGLVIVKWSVGLLMQSGGALIGEEGGEG